MLVVLSYKKNATTNQRQGNWLTTNHDNKQRTEEVILFMAVEGSDAILKAELRAKMEEDGMWHSNFIQQINISQQVLLMNSKELLHPGLQCTNHTSGETHGSMTVFEY